jgi:hypothetical protein
LERRKEPIRIRHCGRAVGWWHSKRLLTRNHCGGWWWRLLCLQAAAAGAVTTAGDASRAAGHASAGLEALSSRLAVLMEQVRLLPAPSHTEPLRSHPEQLPGRGRWGGGSAERVAGGGAQLRELAHLAWCSQARCMGSCTCSSEARALFRVGGGADGRAGVEGGGARQEARGGRQPGDVGVRAAGAAGDAARRLADAPRAGDAQPAPQAAHGRCARTRPAAPAVHVQQLQGSSAVLQGTSGRQRRSFSGACGRDARGGGASSNPTRPVQAR